MDQMTDDTEKKQVDPFEKCERCGHAWSDHYNLLPLADGANSTPQHMVGVCKFKDCDCKKFVG